MVGPKGLVACTENGGLANTRPARPLGLDECDWAKGDAPDVGCGAGLLAEPLHASEPS
jgi:2-polyprenyl-3-methyl-5-hydroxy-6-metoxy-1,4-benzoquinol methylase